MAAGTSNLRLGDAVVSWRDVTYVNIGRAGEGGSSEVYLALATSGPRRGVTFAVKIFTAVDRDEWRVNFMREVHVLRDCDHPAIVKVFDEGMYHDRYPFFVMEHLPDTLLKSMRAGNLPDRTKLTIVMQLLSAVNYLSRRDPPAVHRDIKPSNIFLKGGACVLGDFGLIFQVEGPGRGVAGAGKRSGVAEMARSYRTPELVAYHNGGPKPSPASDVFQLGLVAAELFSGTNPLLPDSAEKPLRVQPVAPIQGPYAEPIRSMLGQMLIQETDQRPSASDLLSRWQELFLTLRKKEDADRRAARMQEASREAPEAPPVVQDRAPRPPEHKFGDGVFDDE
jgi:serine/threonine protein kinase